MTFFLKMSYGFLIIILLAITFQLRAQVPNDDIENRILLEFNAPHQSKTNGCTVQPKCVDESLTGKCIEYHNDQWFTFNSGNYPKLYINIMQQSCRDLKGVQLVVLKGEPCQVETYEILTCVSLATQDDIYIEMDSLDKNQDYLINVDGYLHDFCAFQIEVSPNANGLPLARSLNLTTNSFQKDHLIRITWELPDTLQHKIVGFEVFRRLEAEFRSEFFREVALSSNAYGDIQKSYFFEDSITPNKDYFYRLTARQNDGKLLLIDNYQFHYHDIPGKPKFIRSVNIPLEPVKNKESVTIIIYDYQTMNVIGSEVLSYKRKDPPFINYKTYQAIQNKIDKIAVKVINNSTKSTREYTYELWDD